MVVGWRVVDVEGKVYKTMQVGNGLARLMPGVVTTQSTGISTVPDAYSSKLDIAILFVS